MVSVARIILPVVLYSGKSMSDYYQCTRDENTKEKPTTETTPLYSTAFQAIIIIFLIVCALMMVFQNVNILEKITKYKTFIASATIVFLLGIMIVSSIKLSK